MLTNLDNVVYYTVSGNTYPITFPYWAKSDIKAYVTLSDESVNELTQGTDYSLTDPDGVSGTLTKLTAWTDAQKLTIYREVALTQEVDLINGEKIDGEQLEEALDLKAAGLQQMQEQFTRTVKTSIDEVGSDLVIPNTEARQGSGNGTLLGFDGTGQAIVLRDIGSFDADVAATAANAVASANSATLAQKWAENPEDTPVVTGSYSALHHAKKAKASATSASTSATTSTSKALDAEAWAVGQRGGTDVPPTDPTYHNSSKYYHDIITQIISGALRYQGTWTTTGAADYSAISTPRLKGDMFYCQGTACTIDGVTYTQGDLIIFNQDVASGVTILTSMIDKIDNTETVTPDNTCTFKNKTIAFGNNTMTDVASTNTSQTLTNKTIDSKNNTIMCTATEVSDDTSITPTGEMTINFTENNKTLTLGNPPYINYRLTIKAHNGGDYVSFKNYSNNYVTLFLAPYQVLELVGLTASQWIPVSGSTIVEHSPASGYISGNDWKTFWGTGTYHYMYETSTAATDYDLPHNYVSVNVVWEKSTRATATAIQWNNVSTASTVWVRKMHDTWQTDWVQESPAKFVVVDGDVAPTNEYIGNKQVYCKAVSFTYGSSGNVEKAHGISTSDYGNFVIVRIEGYTNNANPRYFPINYHDSSAYNCMSADRTKIYGATSDSNLYGRNGVCYIYFTKP